MSEKTTITLDSTIVRADNLVAADLDDEVVMMSIERSAYYGLDAIGARIWKRLETPLSVQALCEGLLPEFDVTAEQGQADVLAFLNELYEEDIIRLVEATTA